jgi:hypothetical protein
MVGDDGDALCMRVTSDKPHEMKSGETGYIHKGKLTEFKKQYRPVAKPERHYINTTAIYKHALNRTKHDWIVRHADQLGVSLQSLSNTDGIGAAWFGEYRAWGFPMLDGYGNIIGIRLRNEAGEKWAIKGSRSGIFYSCHADTTMVVVEGPTDTAAAISCGLFAVGRPSCSAGTEEILKLIRRTPKVRRVVIVADNDEPKKRPDGSVFYPGIEGAEKLAKQLRIDHCILTLPCKDMREFYRNGGNSRTFGIIAGNCTWTICSSGTSPQT